MGERPRDVGVVLAARAVRAFAQGFLSVLLALILARKGLGLRELGLFFSAGVLGGAVQAALLGWLEAAVGRRSTLVGLTIVHALCAALIVEVDALPGLLALSFFGSLAGVGGAGGAGPAQPLEQAILADRNAAEDRPAAFGRYRLTGTLALALGALAAGAPVWLEGAGLMTQSEGEDGMLLVFALCLLATAAIYLGLDRGEGTARSEPGPRNPFRSESRRIIFGMNTLFAVDQLASSLTTGTLMAYWFHTRFGLDADALGYLSFVAQGLAAASIWLSVRLAARIGLIRTMVFTHIPASLLLLAVALTSSPTLAIALWLARAALSQMDIPARDALTMSVVPERDRVAMASVHMMARNGVGTVGPTLSTVLWQGIGASAPLIGCGILKIAYDVALFVIYESVEDRPRQSAPLPPPPGD